VANRGTTVNKTLAPYICNTSQNSTSQKSLSQELYRSLKVRTLNISWEKFALLKLHLIRRKKAGKQKQKQNKNKKLAAD
jgi:hypothetical protein